MNVNSDVPPFLLSSVRFGIQLGLTRMESLMRRLGNPQTSLKCIHVAGTNGKGSTVAFIASVLAEAGYRTGVYTSPFLERFSERIRILDGRRSLSRYRICDSEGEIATTELFRLSDLVALAVKEMLHDNEEHPTEFELVTALAFLYFSEQKCDYVVLETGLGGRLDSTNIIESPVATVITALGYDHTDRLGSTMREIAGEKSGILKKNCPLFLYDPHFCGLSDEDAKDAYEVIRSRADALSCDVTVVSPEMILPIHTAEDGQVFRLSFFPQELKIQLLGDHQRMNAALAVRTVLGWVPDAVIPSAVAKTTWKARLEVFSHDPLILLDGGHNPQGANAFRESVDSLFTEKFLAHAPVLVIGIMRDKDVDRMLSALFSDLRYDLEQIICVTPENPRALPAEELKQKIQDGFCAETLFYKNQGSMYNRQGKITAYPTVAEGCREALRLADGNRHPLLFVGSLYLAGEVRSFLKHELKETTNELA